MTSTELILLFALAMAVISVVAIAIDWVGKPIRRRFIPRMYRYPDELPDVPDPTRTPWSDASFVMPENPPAGEPIRFTDGRTEWSDAPFVIPQDVDEDEGPAVPWDLDIGDEPATPLARALSDLDDLETELPDEEPIAVAAPTDHETDEDTDQDTDTAPDADRDEPVPVAVGASEAADTVVPAPAPEQPDGGRPARSQGWRQGEYIYNLTRDGNEPTPRVVSARFWKNVALTEHADIFGPDNRERMANGGSPQRRNHRTGRLETMRLTMFDYEHSGGHPPQPHWPTDGIDPFEAS